MTDPEAILRAALSEWAAMAGVGGEEGEDGEDGEDALDASETVEALDMIFLRAQNLLDEYDRNKPKQ